MEIGIYVHIPFCVSKCYYCDFLSYEGRSKQVKEKYLQALYQEIKIWAQYLENTMVKTIYIGGGTPTCLTGGQLFELLTVLKDSFNVKEGSEITVEGNPGTIERTKLLKLLEGGCNRLSLGVQSFNPQELKSLGRIHSTRDVYNTYELAQKEGFNNISIDLMYGLPGQRLKDWKTNLQQALELNPQHLSLYQLSIEKNTYFHTLLQKGLLQEFDQDAALLMYEEAINYLVDKGYEHYEIGNFAKPGRRSFHNQIYWLNEEYLGLGAGASGFFKGIRYTNLRELELYQNEVANKEKPVEQMEEIDRDLSMSETMFLGLRLLRGVNKARFYDRYQVELAKQYEKEIQRLEDRGLIKDTGTHFALTRKGLYIANEVFIEFLR